MELCVVHPYSSKMKSIVYAGLVYTTVLDGVAHDVWVYNTQLNNSSRLRVPFNLDQSIVYSLSKLL